MADAAQREIVLPETKPETEWLRGRAVQKVSPKRKHGELQLWLGATLRAWARGRGRVASEWRFRISPPGEVTRPLVPDISYLSYERMRGRAAGEWDTPLVAPDVAVEIRSPSDRTADIADKVATLLRAGTRLVVVIDPEACTLTAHEARATHDAHVYTERDTWTHPALPDFRLDVGEMFAEVDDSTLSP